MPSRPFQPDTRIDGDPILFAETEASTVEANAAPWRILIVDDDDDVHEVTRYAVGHEIFDGRPLAFLSARSAAEARDLLRREPDIAMILLDVVMETERAGLDLIPFIRAQLKNHAVRIVLRTGQPGLAQEKPTIATYDIHDYKTKSELTAGKLYATVLSSLRAYRDIRLSEWRALKSYTERVERELAAARSMQAELTPSPGELAQIAEKAGLEVTVHVEVSSELGGDSWAVIDFGGGRAGFLLVDFSGHGIAAAINVFRFHLLLTRHPPNPEAPGEWMEEINRLLYDFLQEEQFAALFFGVVDSNKGLLRYAGCGGPHPILVMDDRVTPLDASGLVLGIEAQVHYPTQEIPFPPGASLLLYSDALNESRSVTCPPLGQDGVEQLCLRISGSAQPLAEILATAITPRRPLKDDLTLIWISRPPVTEVL